MSSTRKRLVMWQRLMLIHGAAERQHATAADTGTDTSNADGEIQKPMAGVEPARPA